MFCNQNCYLRFKSAGGIQKPCLACGKIIAVPRSYIEKGRGIYCSIACRDSGVKRLTFICASCGEKFALTEAQYYNTKSIGRGKYCSNKCKHNGACGENAPAWSGGKIARSFYVYQRNAAKKGLEFSISFDEFSILKNGKCRYCGSNDEIGIDRIDSNKGYSIDNAAPCCRACNQMKWNRTTGEFIKHIKRVLDFYREGTADAV